MPTNTDGRHVSPLNSFRMLSLNLSSAEEKRLLWKKCVSTNCWMGEKYTVYLGSAERKNVKIIRHTSKQR